MNYEGLLYTLSLCRSQPPVSTPPLSGADFPTTLQKCWPVLVSSFDLRFGSHLDSFQHSMYSSVNAVVMCRNWGFDVIDGFDMLPWQEYN